MARRSSFQQQILSQGRQRESTPSEQLELAAEITVVADDVTTPFQSKFAPSEMRQLALVAHNHMKPAMKEFIQMYSEVLMKFRITGTQTTMRMCKTLWGEDNPDIEYGLTCTSGPLGGDAQIASLMCMEDLGALIFFVDPLSAHPHQADIDSLIRLSNCGNVIVCPNPTSAMSMIHTLRGALEKGSRGMIPSFFETLESPAVAEYKHQQELALMAAVTGKPNVMGGRPMLGTDPSMYFPPPNKLDSNILDHSDHGSDSHDDVEGGGDDDSDDEEYLEFVEKMDEVRGRTSAISLMSDAQNSQASRVSYVSLYGLPQPKRKKGALWKLKKSLSKSISKGLRS